MPNHCTKFIFFVICLLPFISHAEEKSGRMITLQIGASDFDQDNTDLVVGGEYRHHETSFYNIKPVVGVSATNQGAGYIYAGLQRDFKIKERFVLTPGWAVGAYTQGSEGKNLGHAIEFRSSIEAGYQLNDTYRLGLNFAHISNADLGNKNPGTDNLSVVIGKRF